MHESYPREKSFQTMTKYNHTYTFSCRQKRSRFIFNWKVRYYTAVEFILFYRGVNNFYPEREFLYNLPFFNRHDFIVSWVNNNFFPLCLLRALNISFYCTLRTGRKRVLKSVSSVFDLVKNSQRYSSNI